MKQTETAILMAAGLGSRMRPITETVPKPLVKVHGVPLIETVIRALKKRQVSKIYIVTGYLKEQFAYLTEKYSNITLIENTEFMEKNNISSLYAAGEVLGESNCFICEADLYLKNPDILLGEIEQSCYFGKMVKGYSSDWLFDMEDNRITHVHKGGNDTYNMVGISYWLKEDAQKIQKAIRQAYEKEGHEQLFWDEIVDGLLDEMSVQIYEVFADSIVEVDTVEELNALNAGEEV